MVCICAHMAQHQLCLVEENTMSYGKLIYILLHAPIVTRSYTLLKHLDVHLINEHIIYFDITTHSTRLKSFPTKL